MINFHGKHNDSPIRVLLFSILLSLLSLLICTHYYLYFIRCEKGLPTQHQSIYYNSQSPTNNNNKTPKKYILFFAYQKKEKKRYFPWKKKKNIKKAARLRGKTAKKKQNNTQEKICIKKHKFSVKRKRNEGKSIFAVCSYILSYVQAQPKRAYTRKLTTVKCLYSFL